MLDEQNKKKHVDTCDVGLTYDIIDESLYMPIIAPSTNLSCSTSTSTSSSGDGLTCDASLVVENENIKKEVNKLTHTLAKAYGGEDRLLMCLVAKELLFIKRDWAIPPRKGRQPLLLTKLVL